MSFSGSCRNAILVVGLLLVIACSPTRGCVESNFELASESRLPGWLELPAEVARKDVAIELYSYVPPLRSTDDQVFVVTVKGRKVSEVSGRSWLLPRTKKVLDRYYATIPRPAYPNPRYEVVQINGKVDVMEFREYSQQNRDPMRAVFWMADDADILREGRDSVKDAESLRTR